MIEVYKIVSDLTGRHNNSRSRIGRYYGKSGLSFYNDSE